MSFFKKLFSKKEKEEEKRQNIEIEIKDNKEEQIEKEEKEEITKEIVSDVEIQKHNIEGEADEKKGFFQTLKDKLVNSRKGFFGQVKSFFIGRKVIDDEMYDELEELLVQSDIGLDMTVKIISKLEKEVKNRGVKEPSEVYEVLKDIMEDFLVLEGNELTLEEGKMNVVLIVGVNGVGKTTTIGKIASKYGKQGKKVIIGAGDTFRAAAVEQVEEWGKRANCRVIKPLKDGGDPGAVIFDTLKIAKEEKADLVILDTAGRLHNKNNLMAELEKINNIIKKNIGDTYYESLLVIDGTTGQNALSQAKIFNEVTNLTGFIVTKLDGTAKGGVLFSISEELKKPIKYIGVGEKVEDLREFNPKEYINAIFE